MKNDFKNFLAYLLFNKKNEDMDYLKSLAQQVDFNNFYLSFSLSDAFTPNFVSSSPSNRDYMVEYERKSNMVPVIEPRPLSVESFKKSNNRILMDPKTYVNLWLKIKNVDFLFTDDLLEEIVFVIDGKSFIFNNKNLDLLLKKEKFLSNLAGVGNKMFIPFSSLFNMFDNMGFFSDQNDPEFQLLIKKYLTGLGSKNLDYICAIYDQKDFVKTFSDPTDPNQIFIFNNEISASLIDDKNLEKLNGLFDKLINSNDSSNVVYDSVFHLLEAEKRTAKQWAMTILKSHNRKNFILFLFNYIETKKSEKSHSFHLIWSDLNEAEREYYLSFFDDNKKTLLSTLAINYNIPNPVSRKEINKL